MDREARECRQAFEAIFNTLYKPDVGLDNRSVDIRLVPIIKTAIHRLETVSKIMLDEPAGGKSAYIVWKHNLIKVSLHLAACLSKSFDQKFVAPILKAVTVLQAKSPMRYMFTNTQVPNLDYT